MISHRYDLQVTSKPLPQVWFYMTDKEKLHTDELPFNPIFIFITFQATTKHGLKRELIGVRFLLALHELYV